MEIIREEQSFCWSYWFCILFAIICLSPLVIQQLPAPPPALPSYPFLSLIFLISQTNPGGRWKVCYAFYKALLRHFVCVCVCVCASAFRKQLTSHIYRLPGHKKRFQLEPKLAKKIYKMFPPLFFLFCFYFLCAYFGYI